jgi:hypothetical protein
MLRAMRSRSRSRTAEIRRLGCVRRRLFGVVLLDTARDQLLEELVLHLGAPRAGQFGKREPDVLEENQQLLGLNPLGMRLVGGAAQGVVQFGDVISVMEYLSEQRAERLLRLRFEAWGSRRPIGRHHTVTGGRACGERAHGPKPPRQSPPGIGDRQA